MSDFEYPSIDVGERIKARRIELGLTLQDLADHVHVARSTIQRYETANILRMKMPVLYSIAQALDVNPDWLVGKSDKMEVPDENDFLRAVGGWATPKFLLEQAGISTKEYALVCAYRRATPEDRQIIDNIASRYSPSEQKKSG